MLTGQIEGNNLILQTEILTQIHHSVVSQIVVCYYLRQQFNTGCFAVSTFYKVGQKVNPKCSIHTMEYLMTAALQIF